MKKSYEYIFCYDLMILLFSSNISLILIERLNNLNVCFNMNKLQYKIQNLKYFKIYYSHIL